MAAETGSTQLAPSAVYRFVMGLDSEPTVMSQAELGGLADPMGMLLRQGRFPLTVHDLLAELDAAGTLPLQRSYLVSEAGQIPLAGSGSLQRDLRFAITRAQAANVDLLISTSATGDPAATFLQAMGWDGTAGQFNYYMRLDRTWVWAGNSYSALAPESRGQGCFDSHVNGSMVMKELKQPWMHWQSMNATILLAPDDPLRNNPLYRSLSGAEDLERTVRAGVSRWTAARLQHAVTPEGRVTELDRLLRQLCTTTTVNLASSVTASSTVVDNPARPLTLPLGFWLNADSLLDELGIPARFVPPSVAGQLYLAVPGSYTMLSWTIGSVGGLGTGMVGVSGWVGQSAAIYCRISRARDDDQTGVDRQERLCREVAERLGLVIAAGCVFVDNNRSAWQRSRRRPGWDALLEAIRAGRVGHVLVYHPDRLMRQPRDLEELLTLSEEHDITLHGQANRRDLSDPDDRFFLRIEVAHACRSSDDTSRRLRDALEDRARAGQVHAGAQRPYGYARGGMVIIESEAEVVREIFARYLEGDTPGQIARKLNERGVVTAGGFAMGAGVGARGDLLPACDRDSGVPR